MTKQANLSHADQAAAAQAAKDRKNAAERARSAAKKAAAADTYIDTGIDSTPVVQEVADQLVAEVAEMTEILDAPVAAPKAKRGRKAAATSRIDITDIEPTPEVDASDADDADAGDESEVEAAPKAKRGRKAKEVTETSAIIVPVKPKLSAHSQAIYDDLMGQLTDSNVLFNVIEEGVMSTSGLIIPGKKTLINASTNQPMSVVSSTYRTVSNEEIFNSFLSRVLDSGIDANDAQVNVRFANNGAKTMVDFRFPNETVTPFGDTSQTQLQIVALNSFDGSTRYVTKVGGFRMKCLNGQIIGKTIGAYSSAHHPGLNVDKGAAKVIAMLQNFRGAGEYWSALMTRKISEDVAMEVIAQFLGVDYTDQDAMNTPAVRAIAGRWDSYRDELGNNAYAIYNALTDYVSHKTYKEETHATGMVFNQGRLERVLEANPLFA